MTTKNTLHLLPTWDEEDVIKDNQGRVEVVVYSNAPYIELELNGEVVGTATATVRKMEENDVYITYDAERAHFLRGTMRVRSMQPSGSPMKREHWK